MSPSVTALRAGSRNPTTPLVASGRDRRSRRQCSPCARQQAQGSRAPAGRVYLLHLVDAYYWSNIEGDAITAIALGIRARRDFSVDGDVDAASSSARRCRASVSPTPRRARHGGAGRRRTVAAGGGEPSALAQGCVGPGPTCRGHRRRRLYGCAREQQHRPSRRGRRTTRAASPSRGRGRRPHRLPERRAAAGRLTATSRAHAPDRARASGQASRGPSSGPLAQEAAALADASALRSGSPDRIRRLEPSERLRAGGLAATRRWRAVGDRGRRARARPSHRARGAARQDAGAGRSEPRETALAGLPQVVAPLHDALRAVSTLFPHSRLGQVEPSSCSPPTSRSRAASSARLRRSKLPPGAGRHPGRRPRPGS